MVLEHYTKKIENFVDSLNLPHIIQTSLIIKYNDIIEFDPDLGEFFLDDPDNFLTGMNNCISDKIGKIVDTRIKGISTKENVYVPIKYIRSERLNKMIVVEGIIRQVSAVKPKITFIKFECPSCSNIINILQRDRIIKQPSRCGCGRKGKFKKLEIGYIDCQRLIIEEPIETLDMNEQPKRFNVLLFKDLTSPKTTKINTPGNRVKISGILREYGKFTKAGETTERELLLEANYIEPTEESFIDISLTEKDIEQIKEFSKKEDYLQILINSLAPDIEEYEIEKEAILYHLVGGNKIIDAGKLVRIGDIHILLIADTGTAKTKLIRSVQINSPKMMYVDATGISDVGMTASIIKDDFLGGYAIEAGALVLSNNGSCVIDEIDKMDKEDRKALHIAMSEQIIIKHKANIHSTMRSETGVIGLSNPKLGRFDDNLSVSEQIDMPPSLINRFDLIFPFKDRPEEKRDSKIIKSMLKIRKEKIKRELDPVFVKKYLNYAKLNFQPVLTEKAEEEVEDYYIKMRGSTKSIIDSKIIPITPRQGETLIKLAQASAKLRLSDKATSKDIKKAEKIMNYFLTQVGIDPETGEIDIEKIEGLPSASKKYRLLDSILRRLSDRMKIIPVEEILRETNKVKIEDNEAEEILEKMKRKGDLIEPKIGLYQIL